MTKDIINLRPHHLLCILNFVGMGYSPHFVRIIKNVKRKLEEDLVYIRIVEGQDDLCASCPNARACESLRYIQLLDEKVIKAADLRYGAVYTAGELLAMIENTITPDLLTIICRECAFYVQCKKIYSERVNRNPPDMPDKKVCMFSGGTAAI